MQWNLARDDEHYDAIAAAMQLRADMREYTLRTNRATASTGLPMVRAMVLAFPDDPACAAATPLLESQWMFGPSFLVAPVLSATATSRDVYLPDIRFLNATWLYRWNSSDAGQGGAVVTVNVTDMRDVSSAEIIPTFTRHHHKLTLRIPFRCTVPRLRAHPLGAASGARECLVPVVRVAQRLGDLRERALLRGPAA